MYTRMKILQQVGIHVNNLEQLYKSNIVNFRGKVDGELYTEIIA